VGAFAVVTLVIVMLMQFAAVYTVVDGGRFLALLAAICVISRCCSAFSIFVLRHSSISTYSALLGKRIDSGNKISVIAIALGAIAFSYVYAGFYGLIVSFTVIFTYVFSLRIVYKDFKGISGDLLGYSLVISEVCGLIALAFLQGLEIRI
jgi:adenosylcobinamide-GDP ribazoletransferase